jgi:glutathione synthase/RimK-type ligase-like ATP-grasp enzyme
VPTVLLLTAATMFPDDGETSMLAGALADLGVQSRIVAWTADGLADFEADLVIIRTTWDYTTRLPEFLTVLGSLTVPLRNDIDIVRWNSHKGYLIGLAEAGVPVVPTRLLRADDLVDGAVAQLPDFGTPEIVIKPTVSAGARGAGRFPAGAPQASEHLLAVLGAGDALVQAFQPEVALGERSLVFLGGHLSHAVLKTPAAGDYRVQEWLGGVNAAHRASAAEIAVAEAAMAAVPGGAARLLYARVDLIGSLDTPLVMELELIEPSLFLPFGAGSAGMLARAAAALL